MGKEKGKGERKNLAGRRENPSPAREKKTEPGSLLVGLGQRGHRGQAARRRRAHPLGSAHAGEGAGGGAMVAFARSQSLVVLATLR